MDLNHFGEFGLAMERGSKKRTSVDEVHCRTRRNTVRVARHQIDDFPNVSAILGIVRLRLGLCT
jgi:hypothetical protein